MIHLVYDIAGALALSYMGINLGLGMFKALYRTAKEVGEKIKNKLPF